MSIQNKALSEVELLKEIYKKLAGESPALDLNKALSKAALLRGIAEVAKPIPVIPSLPEGVANMSIYRLNNGDDLPEGVSPEMLIVDTGVIDPDESTQPTYVQLFIPSGYQVLESFAKDENGTFSYEGYVLTLSKTTTGGTVSLIDTYQGRWFSSKPKESYSISTDSDLFVYGDGSPLSGIHVKLVCIRL